jgi:hypothetical protein
MKEVRGEKRVGNRGTKGIKAINERARDEDVNEISLLERILNKVIDLQKI